MLLTITDFAKVKGLSRQRVSKAVQTGKLEGAVVNRGKKKFIDKDLGLELWDRTTPITHKVAIPTQTKEELKKQVDEMAADEIPDFNISRAKKEFYTAELARIQVEQQKKELISAKEVEKKSFEMAVGIREAFLTLPDRVSNLFASETDASAIDSVMRQEIHSCLERFVEAA